jgi:hypothetical protein
MERGHPKLSRSADRSASTGPDDGPGAFAATILALR